MVLIEAFVRIARSGMTDMNLVMCGDPRIAEDQLRAPLREYGLDHRLIVTGYAAREDMPDLYREAVCVVVPSKLEGFGMTALEALACGKPLIVSGDAALAEVAGEACLTFKTGDAQDFARVLRHLLRDPHEAARLGRLAVERARGFSWEASALAHADVYRELLSTMSASQG
jgi:glycosyltransferase involved in cell wall biosynthesis